MRNLGLDVLRFCAVLLVLGQHLNGSYLPDSPPWAQGFLWLWQRGGGVGVTLFFVLSGFLISGLLFDEFRRTKAVDVRRFLIRRGFKLYPPLWALIGFTALMNGLTASRPWDEFLPKALAEVFFVQNYFPGLFGHSWTLAVEEHFYIAFSALVAWLCSGSSRNPFQSIPLIWLAATVTCSLLRLRAVASSATPEWSDFRTTHLCVDALMYGVLISYLCRFRRLDVTLKDVPSAALLATGALCVSLGFSDRPPSLVAAGATPVLNFVGCGFLLLAARRLKAASHRLLAFIGLLGSTSYSTYLWHGWTNIAAGRALEKAFGYSNTWPYVLLYVAGSFAVGMAMHRLVEQPVMALRDRLYPSRTGFMPAAMPRARRRVSKQSLPATAGSSHHD